MQDNIIFLSRCPELENRLLTNKLLEMCCLFLNHATINVLYVGLGSASPNVDAPV